MDVVSNASLMHRWCFNIVVPIVENAKSQYVRTLVSELKQCVSKQTLQQSCKYARARMFSAKTVLNESDHNCDNSFWKKSFFCWKDAVQATDPELAKLLVLNAICWEIMAGEHIKMSTAKKTHLHKLIIAISDYIFFVHTRYVKDCSWAELQYYATRISVFLDELKIGKHVQKRVCS
jgi:hypothetical protein